MPKTPLVKPVDEVVFVKIVVTFLRVAHVKTTLSHYISISHTLVAPVGVRVVLRGTHTPVY